MFCNRDNPDRGLKDFPYLLWSLANKLEIYPYKNIPIEEYYNIIKKYYNIKNVKGKSKCEILYPLGNNLEKYKIFENNKDELSEKDYKYIMNENKAYLWALENFKLSMWVSKEIGDGLGFDVYAFFNEINPDTEHLIEAKYSSFGNFLLTDNEYKVMLSTNKYDYAFYYVYCRTNFSDNPLILTYNKNHEDALLTNYYNKNLLYSLDEKKIIDENGKEQISHKINEYQRKLF